MSSGLTMLHSPSYCHLQQIIHGTHEGKRVQIPRGPAAVTGDDPRNATVSGHLIEGNGKARAVGRLRR